MNNTLLLALKNAGFSQIGEGKTIGPYDTSGTEFPPNEFVFVPTLEELIDACGDNLFTLLRRKFDPSLSWKDKWPEETTEDAVWFAYQGDEKEIGQPYATPSEAVANLWLELKKP